MTKSLGEIMRENILTEEETKYKKEQEHLARQKANEERERKTIIDFFDEAKEKIQHDILNGKTTVNIKCKRNGNKTFQYTTMELMKGGKLKISEGVYADIVEDFMAWVGENGLVATFNSGHDGMGMESWTEIVVTPL